MERLKNLLRALVLLPAAGAGGLSAVAVSDEGPTDTSALLQLYGVLIVCYAIAASALVWLWRRTDDEYRGGLSREAWTILIVVAYGVGLWLVLAE